MTLNLNLLLAALAAALLLGFITLVLAFLARRRPGKLNQEHFISRWQDLQVNCKAQNTWPLAVIEADKLLDEALKKLHYRGKTMGERLVSAQHDISDNDGVWYGHKLRNKIVHEQIDLKQKEVQGALQGFREALRDLRAL
jgi:hypothetical protein